ncbi:MAG TPA: TIGR02281 family clan AA aspartic protease [Hyphomicrobiaceae bacterium]|jgi:aspartyl protease family protein|nr:TIGR02281 family clan AA aspartic protease [Hyphomicrobiaceae bacterium]
MGAWIALTLLMIAGLALLLRADAGSIAGFDPSDFAIGVAGVAMLIFLGSSIAGSYRGRLGQAARDLVAWTAMALLLVTGYSYRNEILSLGHRVMGELLPPGAILRSESQVEGEQSVRIRKRSDGHFIVRMQVNGVTMSMLVDTGASTVVLKPTDAQKLGIDPERLRYSVPVQTANGTTYAAHVRLRTLTLGPIHLTDIDALVAKPGALKENLLGMSFLSRLRSYEFSGDYLTLRS